MRAKAKNILYLGDIWKIFS